MSTGHDTFPWMPSRLWLFGILFGGIVVWYLLHLYFMQVVEIELYTNRADRVSRRTELIDSSRGLIFDRHFDEPVATNFDVFALYLNPEDAGSQERIDQTLENLSVLLSLPLERLDEKVPSKARFMQAVELIEGVDFLTIQKIAEDYEHYPGVSWETKSIRTYPAGKDLAHVLGFIGEITPTELQVMYNRGYDAKSVIGKDGIERIYDAYLQGTDGLRIKRVDARGQRIGVDKEVIQEPVAGKNLVLTIDRKIQELTAKALGPRIGSALVMKPHSGEILAMVSYPSYDPNLFYTDQAGSAFSTLSRNTSGPFINRAIQSADAPASTWKVLMNAAVYDTLAFSPNKTIFCSGSVQIGNRVFNCHLRSGHGALDIHGALAQSCNVFYYTIGAEYLGVETIVEYADRFGFGSFTGIDLPGEIVGLLPDPRWKQDVFKTRWVGGDTVNMSIGQGYLQVTPIQLANMVAMVVNDGVTYTPRVLKAVRDPVTSRVIEEFGPQVLRRETFRPGTLEQVRKDMRGVITQGTAAPIFTTKAVEVAGKTGTAQTGRGEDRKHSWFVAYGPYNAPDPEDMVVVVVWVDAANPWEWWAPKAAHLIFHGIFSDMTYEETVADLSPLWYLSENAVDSITGVAQ